jgi:nucleoside diphosphate kinase
MVDRIDWDRHVFVLAAPDALARHLGGEVVRRLAATGFMPAGWRVVWHRPPNLDAFHERNITQVWKAYLYRLVDRLFAFGPTVALLVRDTTPHSRLSSHQRLRLVRGGSEPVNASPGTIRGDLGSINAMLALLHSADSPADSHRESGVFAGPSGFEHGEPVDLDRLLALLELGRPAERRGYEAVVAGVRARMIVALWDELSPAARGVARALLDRGIPGLAEAEAGGELADLLEPAGHPLAQVLRCAFEADSPGIDLDRARAVLRTYGTDLDPWEDLVLATSMRFAPRRTGT